MPSSSLQAVWMFMVFSYLHFQVGTWTVIIKRFHAVSKFVLWTLRFYNADAGVNVRKTGVLSNLSRLSQLVLSFKSSEIRLKLKKEYRFLSLERYSKMYRLSRKLKFGHLFSRRSFAGMAKKFTKELSARPELLFCLWNLILRFLTFSFPSPS